METKENPPLPFRGFDKILFENLSLRTLNCLKTADILTLEQLRSKSMSELSLIRNLGKFCLEEIERFLSSQKNDEVYKFENVNLGMWYSDEQMETVLNNFHKKGWETINLVETRGSGYAKILLKRRDKNHLNEHFTH